MSSPIGIDLGTTNSVVATLEGGVPKIIENQRGGRTTPSIVGFTGTGVVIGKSARNQQVTNPRNTIYSVKRFMGRRHSEVQEEERIVGYQIVGEPHEMVQVIARDVVYTPEQISAFILAELKKTAETYLGESVTEAVITVPAYFNDAQRTATKNAGEIAGLKVLRVLPEPTAAALAYGIDGRKKQKVCVFDLGGGTFDVSVLDIAQGLFEVCAISGDSHLGGDDFDQALLRFLVDEFKQSNGIDLASDAMAFQRLKDAAESAKIELSGAMQAEINLPCITVTAQGPLHLQTTVSRSTFERLIAPLVERCRAPVLDALQQAKLQPTDIDEVLLVGGSTRVPCVASLVQALFQGKTPNRSVNPDEVVAMGAAVQAGIITGQLDRLVVLDCTPLSLGVETEGGAMDVLIPRNTTIPTRKKQVYSTSVDNQPMVEVHIVQGERPFVVDNRSLGRFQLTGIPPAPRGIPRIEVTFDIDANGILSVSALDRGTSQVSKITIQGSGNLSKDEIARMQREAEQFAEQDRANLELIELRNMAEGQADRAKASLRELGNKVNAELVPKVTEAASRLMELAKKGDSSAQQIREASDALTALSHQVAKAIYGEASVEPSAASEGGTL